MRNKLLLLGIGLIAVALLVIAVSLLSIPATPVAGPSRVTQSGKLNPGAGSTARAAYTSAQTWMQTWADDTQLVAASTTIEYPDVTSGWTLQLYSPSRRRIAIVLITGDAVELLQEQPALYAQTPITLADWTQDSDAIFERWWQERGGNIWTQPNSKTLLLHLGMSEAGLAWQITVLDDQGDLKEHQAISASTGNVNASP